MQISCQQSQRGGTFLIEDYKEDSKYVEASWEEESTREDIYPQEVKRMENSTL